MGDNTVAPSSLYDLLSTPLCDLLGIRYPIIQAPMAGGWTTLELVAAVCNADGLGVLAGARVSLERLREGPEPLGWPLHGVVASDIHAASRAAENDDYSPLFAGQGLRMLEEGQGAAEVVAEVVDEARAASARLGGGL